MSGLPKYYTTLFNATEEAIAALDRQDYGTAKTLILQGQLRAEDLYMSESEKDQEET